MQSAWNRAALNPMICKILVGMVGLGLLLIALFHQPWIPVEIRHPETGVLAAMPAPVRFEFRDSSDSQTEAKVTGRIEQVAAISIPDPSTAGPKTEALKTPVSSPPLKQTAEAEPAEIFPKPAPPTRNEVHADKKAALGKPAELPREPARSPTGTKKLARPTVWYELPTPFQIPASETGLKWNFVIPTGVQKDLFLMGVEWKPGNTKLVKRMILSYDLTGQARKQDQQTSRPGFPTPNEKQILASARLAEWTPDKPAATSPRKAANRIPAGADLILTIEYAATPIAETDPWTMGLYLSRPQQK